jgi:YHS domain-containing protein
VTLLLWIARLLLLLIVIRLVLRLLANSRAAARGRTSPQPAAPERSGGTLVRDPHCGTYVPRTRAIAVGSGDGTVYFCSAECRDAFALTAPRRAS